MLTELSIVNEFHEVFKIGKAPKKLTLLPSKECQLRYDLGKEELDEYLEACQNNDLKEVADSLGDQLYILCGTILKHGLQYKIYDVIEEIHRSNMSKLDENGEPIFRADGKVLKSSNYFKPDLKKVLGL